MSQLPYSDEAARQSVLDHLRIVGTPRSADFDCVLTLARQVFDCAIGVIGFYKQDRHWFKAETGLGCGEVPRALSIGNLTLMQSAPLISEDTSVDPRFCDHPRVVDNGIRFYAGVAFGIKGVKIGTLCLADTRPRLVTPGCADQLTQIGLVIEALLETHARLVEAMALAEIAEAREREIWKKTRMLEQSARMAKIGAWEFDVASGMFCLSDEACIIHELPVGTRMHIDDMHARFPSSDLDRVAARYKNAVRSGEGYEIVGEIITAKGERRWTHRIIETEKRDGDVVRIFSAIRDVSAERQAEQVLWRAAHFDALTKAPNRHYWTKRLDEAFAHADTDQGHLTILMMDLDGFKEINDTKGHAIGDTVLRNVAQRLSETIPLGAFYARLGGDEFAVLIEGSLNALQIDTIMRALVSAIQAPIVIDMVRLQVSGTFGCATYPADASNASDLMQKADIALYQAKRSHRNSFVAFSREIAGVFNDKHQAIELVAAAIEQKRLVPFYQPKFNMKTGLPAGFEALCRIKLPDGTILGPADFLPALQDPASSARIGIAMLELVTADIAFWRGEGLSPGRVALNVTGADFVDGRLCHRIMDRLADLAIPPSALEIEVTENTILGKEARVVGATLQAMSDQGIVISLDDFGTGFASLTHLRDAPIQYLKLDRSFIAGLGRRADSSIITKSIVSLAHNLNMRVVAEGIETTGQAEFLRAIGCDEAQGFLYGRPVSREDTLDILFAMSPSNDRLASA